MEVMRNFFVGASFLFVCACGYMHEPEGGRVISVSSLLVDLDRYAGHVVTVTGYLQYDRQFRIYQDEAAANEYDMMKSVRVRDLSQDGSLGQSDCVNRMVLLTGTLVMLDIEQGMEVPLPHIRDVTIVRVQGSERICWTVE